MRLTIGLVLLILLAFPALPATKSDVEWIPSLDRAAERARAEAKPLLIEFWASWCAPCRRMDQESWSSPRVVELTKRYVAASVDVDRATADSGRFIVHSLPTVILADPWGRPLIRREGFVHPGDLAAILAEVPADFSPVREVHDALERNSKDTQALAAMGRFFVKADSPRFGNEFYAAAIKTKDCDSQLRCELTLAIGLDHIVMRDWNGARKLLRQFLKDYPDAPRRERALLGLVIVDYRQGKKSDAAKTLAEMQKDFPLSQDTASAARLLNSDR